MKELLRMRKTPPAVKATMICVADVLLAQGSRPGWEKSKKARALPRKQRSRYGCELAFGRWIRLRKKDAF